VVTLGGCEGRRKKRVRKGKGDLVLCGRGGRRHVIIPFCFVENNVVLFWFKEGEKRSKER